MAQLGDTFYGPLEPRRTAELLSTIDALTVRGNQDRQLYESTVADVAANPSLLHVLTELGQERIEALRKLPVGLFLEGDLRACHGSLQSDVQYLIEDVSLGFPRIRAEHDLERLIGDVKSGRCRLRT